MKLRDSLFVSIIGTLLALPVLAADPSRPYPTDAETGRAIGAKQMAAQELKQKLDSGEPVLLIHLYHNFRYASGEFSRPYRASIANSV